MASKSREAALPSSSLPTPLRSLAPVGIATLLCLPWIVLAPQHAVGTPLAVAALSGLAILGAAFLLSWAAELVQMDVSQALALAMLALIAVLPEYAVDAVFAFQAGQDPAVAQAGYAVANMTGANRLLIGLGWSLLVLIA
jgi:cation:H+ antiporter